MEIITERLILRNYLQEDFENFYLLKTNKAVWEFSTFEIYKNKQEAINDFEKIIFKENKNFGFKILQIKNSGEFIGEAGILSYNQKSNRCVIGYNILPKFWQLGYATEITKKLVDYAFNNLKVQRVEAITLEENIGSYKVLEKSGFKMERVLRNFTEINKKYKNACYFGIIRSDFFNLN